MTARRHPKTIKIIKSLCGFQRAVSSEKALWPPEAIFLFFCRFVGVFLGGFADLKREQARILPGSCKRGLVDRREDISWEENIFKKTGSFKNTDIGICDM